MLIIVQDSNLDTFSCMTDVGSSIGNLSHKCTDRDQLLDVEPWANPAHTEKLSVRHVQDGMKRHNLGMGYGFS